MRSKKQRGSATPNNATGIAVGLIVIALIVAIVVMVGHKGRHKHRAKLVKTKTHQLYVENDDGSCFEFVGSGGGDSPGVDLPKAGSSSFKLPSGSWVKANPPKEEDVAEEEEDAVEESDAGEPEADSSGDIGSDSDSSGGDSGGDSGGGDGGGGDGGGGDGGA